MSLLLSVLEHNTPFLERALQETLLHDPEWGACSPQRFPKIVQIVRGNLRETREDEGLVFPHLFCAFLYFLYFFCLLFHACA